MFYFASIPKCQAAKKRCPRTIEAVRGGMSKKQAAKQFEEVARKGLPTCYIKKKKKKKKKKWTP